MAAAAFASVLVLFGAAASGGENVAGVHLSLGRVLAIYWLIAPVAGVCLGLMRPLGATWLGAALIGWLVGTVVYGGVGLAIDGPTLTTGQVAVVLGLLVGVPCGLYKRGGAG